MEKNLNDFMSQPLWFTIPLVVIYIALLVYVTYIVWRYRSRK